MQREPTAYHKRKAKAFGFLKNKAKAKGDRQGAAFWAGEQRRQKNRAKKI